MKPIAGTIVAICCLVSLVAGVIASRWYSANLPVQLAAFGSAVVELADCIEGEEVQADLIIYNRTDEEVKIRRVSTSCGCVVARNVEAQEGAAISVGPRSQKAIGILIYTMGRAGLGEFSVTALFESASGSVRQEASCAIKLFVKGQLVASPSALYVRRIVADATTEKNFKVVLADNWDRPIRINQVSTSSSRVRFNLTTITDTPIESMKRLFTRRYLLDVAIKLPNSVGGFEEWIEIDHEGNRPLRIPIVGSIESQIRAVPTELVYYYDPSENTVDDTRNLKLIVLEGLRVDSVQVKRCPEFLEVNVTRAIESNNFNVTVRLGSLSRDKAKSEELITFQCLPGNLLVDLPVRMFVAE